MLRIIILIVFSVTFGWIITSFRSRPDGLKEAWHWFSQNCKTLVSDLKRIKTIGMSEILKLVKKGVYILVLICFLILAITGFVPFLIFGEHMSGFTLMLHVAVSPVFAVCMAISALIWAHEHRFDERNWQWVKELILKRAMHQKNIPGMYDFLKKFFFWLSVLFSLSVSSVILLMYPIVGSAIQDFLLGFHRFGAMGVTVAIVMHTYSLIRSQFASVSEGSGH